MAPDSQFTTPIFGGATVGFATDIININVSVYSIFTFLALINSILVNKRIIRFFLFFLFYFEMDFRPGDIQILHNHLMVHTRTAFDVWSQPERKRHLMRLWLGDQAGRPFGRPVGRPAGGFPGGSLRHSWHPQRDGGASLYCALYVVSFLVKE